LEKDSSATGARLILPTIVGRSTCPFIAPEGQKKHQIPAVISERFFEGKKMALEIDLKFAALIPPLTADESAWLRESLKQEGRCVGKHCD